MKITVPNPLNHLQGKIVLIKSTGDAHQQPTAIRGTIEISPEENPAVSRPEIRLVWEIPDMFNEAAHRRRITLTDDESIQRLLASEREGTFEFTLEHELD